MSNINEIEIIVRCNEVLNRYAQAVARRDSETFANLFAPDGIWTRPGPMEMKGRAEIKGFLQDTFDKYHRFIWHMNGNQVVDVVDGETARVHSATVVYEAEECTNGRWLMRPPSYVAEYSDVMKKIDGRWLIQRRDTTVNYVSEHALPLAGIK